MKTEASLLLGALRNNWVDLRFNRSTRGYSHSAGPQSADDCRAASD